MKNGNNYNENNNSGLGIYSVSGTVRHLEDFNLVDINVLPISFQMKKITCWFLYEETEVQRN